MKKGDDIAIETFVRKYYPTILHYCFLHTRDKSYAEDATQEVFERFFRTLDQYRHYGRALNYLYVIASNICHDSYRKHEEILFDELKEEIAAENKPIDMQIDVRLAVDKLPQELRETAILYFFQGEKQTDIAKILGIGLPLVKYRIKRSKEVLARDLRREYMP